jgi:hypothetical protein
VKLRIWCSRSGFFFVSAEGADRAVARTLRDALRKFVANSGGTGYDGDACDALEKFLREHPESEQVVG